MDGGQEGEQSDRCATDRITGRGGVGGRRGGYESIESRGLKEKLVSLELIGFVVTVSQSSCC